MLHQRSRLRNFFTCPFGAIQELQPPVAKNAYGCNGLGWTPAHELAIIPVENSGCPAMVMQKPRAQQPKCITTRDADFGAPSTAALPL
jgi:hypothetical protein